ncbi:MAG: 30S ribosomal protein S4e [Nanoarchaeota archaeon]|nr:30S ribosomal protein S4e [Nanoarchaeota archaeon]
MHLKRVNTPKRWNLAKKTNTFVARPSPGPHKKDFSIPLIVLLRDHLGLVNDLKECKRIVNNKLVLVDNSVVKDVKYPVGLFDTISIPSNKIYYRAVLDYKGGIIPLNIDAKEAGLKLFSILNKKRMKKGIIQLNCSSSRNIIVKKDSYKTGDSILLDLTTKKIVKHLPAKKDSTVLVMHGKHAGELAVIQGFKDFASVSKDRVILKNDKGTVYETMKTYVFVVGEKDSEIKVREVVKK